MLENDLNREEFKRLNGLSVFVQDTERRAQDKESALKITKSKLKTSPGHSRNNYKQLCKSVWSSTKRTNIRKGPAFCKEGDKIVFHFRHFVRPEKLVEEYTRVYIYDKPRFIKKETLQSANPSEDLELSSIVEQLNCRSKLNVKHEKTKNRCTGSEKQTSSWRTKKTTENVQMNKRSQMLRRRIPATHNFVYEFNPFGETSSDPNVRPTAKETTVADKHRPTRAQSMAPLPRINSRDNTAADNAEKRKQKISYEQNANLPVITKAEKLADEGTVKQDNGKREVTEIDREVENVKSKWQLVRGKRNWASSKDTVASNQTRKLYETLERVTQEIEKIQKSYLDKKTNRYLHQSAVKTLDDAPSLEKEAEAIRSVIFPKRNPNGRIYQKDSNTQSASRTSVKTIYTNKEIEPKATLLASESQLQLADHNKLNNLLSKTTTRGRPKYALQNEHERLKEVSSNFEKYLNEYIKDAENSFVQKETRENIKLEPSSDDVTKMLQDLNLHPSNSDHALQNSPTSSRSTLDDANSEKLWIPPKQDYNCGMTIAKKSIAENNTPNCEKGEFKSSTDVGRKPTKSIMRTISTELNNNPENIESSEETFATDRLKVNDDPLEQRFVSFNTSSQTNISDEANVFVKMGWSDLCNGLPRNVLSRILASEYLKKTLP